MNQIEWIDNEKPVKGWRTQKIVQIIMFMITLTIGILVILLIPRSQPFAGVILLFIVLVVELIIFGLAQRKMYSVWPKKVGFSTDEILFKFQNENIDAVKWQNIKKICTIPSQMVETLYYIVDRNDKELDAAIYGDAGLQLNNRFEEYKKGLEKAAKKEST